MITSRDNHIRQQLTLFVDPEDAADIETIRRTYNPVQYQLIKSHVTLCREDELRDIAAVQHALQHLQSGPITLRFGAPLRFDQGRGVFIPGVGSNEMFHQLRGQVLGSSVQRQEPHITLMHPRNSVCTDDIFEVIRQQPLPQILIFSHISLIRQENGGPWQVLESYPL